MKKRVYFIISIILVLGFLFIYMSGFRITSRGASNAHAILSKHATMIKNIHTNVGELYVYKENNYYTSVFSIKDGFLWKAPFGSTTKGINDKNDKIQTVGFIGYIGKNGSATVMIIDVKDKNVYYIEAGQLGNRIRQKVKTNDYAVFNWDEAISYSDANPIALSKEGKVLYKYSSLVSDNRNDISQLRWRQVNK